MNITQQKIDDLNLVLEIEVNQADYEEKVTTILKDYRRKAQIPGFRKGLAPMGMINKMYRNSVLGEELNKILSENLYKYIDEQKLPLLGSPLPSEDEDQVTDISSNADFKFKYQLGLAPTFNVNLSDKDKLDFYKIKIDDALIEKYSKDIRRRYGKVSEIDEAGDEDMLGGKFEELDSSGNIVENGIQHDSTIAIEFIEDEKTKKSLIGLKKESSIVLDPKKVSRGDSDMASMLGIKKKDIERVNGKFKFTVNQVYRMEPAEENQELYDKLFGAGAVSNHEEFKNKVSEILEGKLKVDTDKKMLKDLTEKLIEKLKLPLPDDFLKRWLLISNEGKFTSDQIAEEYDDYAKSLRWQLIESQIIKEKEVKIEHAEVVEHTKGLIKQQMAQYGQVIDDESYLEKSANEILQKEESMRDIYQQVMDIKLMQLYKEILSLKNKEVTFDEFVKIATGKTSKGNVFDKLSNLVKF